MRSAERINELTGSDSGENVMTGFIVYRTGRRIAKRDGDQIYLYHMDGTPSADAPEPVNLIQNGDKLEVYDFSGNQIGVEYIKPTPETS